jgi:hypothetical protein
MWLAGGGILGGQVYGATDDLHATILHLLGNDHERLTYRYSGRDYRLTDVHGHVVDDIIG